MVKVPTSALVRQGDAWALFEVDGNWIRRVPVAVGRRNAGEAEIQSGLDAGVQVIVTRATASSKARWSRSASTPGT